MFVATAVAGVLGYAIQGVAGAGLTAAQYADFGVFWAAMFLIVGGVSGVQQETSRATRAPLDAQASAARWLLPAFALVSAATIAVVLVGTGWVWAPVVFGEQAAGSLGLLVLGGVASVGVATLSGLLYGTHRWVPQACVILLDPALRLLAVAATVLTGRIDLVDAAIVVPIPITLVVGLTMILWHRRGVAIDTGLRRLLANTARTLLGASATAVLISALPLFIGVAGREAPESFVGALLFNLTVTRAPLVIPALAFQSLIILQFRDRGEGVGRLLARYLVVVFSAAVVLGLLAGLFAAPVVEWAFGPDYVIDGLLLGALVVSAGLTAALCITGAVAVARNGHNAYVLGWVLAAVTAIAVLQLPIELGLRTVLALAIGPAVGLAVHLGYLRARAISVVTATTQRNA